MHVAYRERDAAIGEKQDVVPVTADLGMGARGAVSEGDARPGDLRHGLREEAALERERRVALFAVEPRVVQSHCCVCSDARHESLVDSIETILLGVTEK